MNKIPSQIDSEGKPVVLVEDVLCMLNSLQDVAHWGTGEQVLKILRNALEKSIPASAPSA